MKWFGVFCALVLFAGTVLSFRLTRFTYELDMLEANRIIRYIENNLAENSEIVLPTDSYLDFVFVHFGKSLHLFIQNRDTIVPLEISGNIFGYVIFSNDATEVLARSHLMFSYIFYGQVILLAITIVSFALYLWRTILLPFKKLEFFATRVASGDLSLPLLMDYKNRFGAFSESFDLMREQLAISRENERQANISKKELVASLSHDIKTPAASIKIMAELHQAKHGESKEMKVIISKIDQIDLLITNMFTATLEELTQLKVSPVEISTLEIEKEIIAADYKQKIQPFSLPECVLSIDPLRFKQIVDNIIGNAYKYADTEINVAGYFEDNSFLLSIRDFGSGVKEEELSLLCEKFFRASNSAGKEGAGLGLFLTSYFLSKMNASIMFKNDDGLHVVIKFEI